jgi:hypothetical protein
MRHVVHGMPIGWVLGTGLKEGFRSPPGHSFARSLQLYCLPLVPPEELGPWKCAESRCSTGVPPPTPK